MYESVTFEVIMQRMLDRIDDSFDKREGSVIYDALAPAAAELAQMYIELDNTRDLGFIGTSSGEYLERLVSEFGMTRIAATNAVVHGVFNLDNISIGSRFSCEKLNFKAVSKISDKNYRLECETAGTVGNITSGRLIPIDYIEGLTSASVTELLIPARDTETDDELRKRYFSNIAGGAQDGNVAQYEKWAGEYPGIGRYKVTPIWNGVNTVKVTILNEENGAASQTLIDEFQAYLDPANNGGTVTVDGVTYVVGDGLGNGQAPIGAAVTVDTATVVYIDVKTTVTLASGYTTDTAAAEILAAVQEYCDTIALAKDKVKYFSVAAIVDSCPCVVDITSLKIKKSTQISFYYGTSDIALGANEIPAAHEVNITEAT